MFKDISKDWQKNITFGTPIKKKKTLHDPNYRFVNAVKLSLQLGRNTQLRTCIILVIFSRFWNITDVIISNNKNTNIYDIILFEGLSFQNTFHGTRTLATLDQQHVTVSDNC
jgi:hypothetical protein